MDAVNNLNINFFSQKSTDLLIIVSLSLHDGLTHNWEVDGYISWYCAVYVINVP